VIFKSIGERSEGEGRLKEDYNKDHTRDNDAEEITDEVSRALATR
jgi:hypothetical protein